MKKLKITLFAFLLLASFCFIGCGKDQADSAGEIDKPNGETEK